MGKRVSRTFRIRWGEFLSTPSVCVVGHRRQSGAEGLHGGLIRPQDTRLYPLSTLLYFHELILFHYLQ
jgi:hypothetical protein